jgi:adenylosuccinate synthase
MRHIKQAIDMNGVNNLVVNKLDVLREVEAWKTTDNHFEDEIGFRTYLQNELENSMGIQKIYFSDNPYNFDEENPLTAAA